MTRSEITNLRFTILNWRRITATVLTHGTGLRPLKSESEVPMSDNSDDRPLVTRRDFTVESALALLAGVTITISGCGDDDDNGSTAPTPPVADVSASISGNHGHTATLSGAQISSGGALTLNIQGTASHPHTVPVTPAQLQTIAARQQVAITSSSDNGHTHVVTFN